MRFKVCLILTLLFSFCNLNFIQAKSFSNSNILDSISYKMSNESNFIEKGVKVTYKSALKKEEEIKRVKKILEKKNNKEIVVSNDVINIWTGFGNVRANFYSKNNVTIVDFAIIENNKNYSILKLMKELTKLQGKNVYDIRYFQYIKEKINNINDTLVEINKLPEIKNIDTLDIHNGYVGEGKFNNGERVNIALNNYDTGNYLIIGTPVIFTT
ncbi:hypothetical protein SAMN04487886_116112 [Clostridium sp. DSM 8431]|uniref:hypothetical protein n=1 Tax=Clostridium sp. DSM 8431 TaxID=1761781 RepID=UPI0008DF88AA|nr:hypothetical protein [Clostridium sp. DSM 8431]SFU78735.1 hypothetical protein SAMN04487886_116112 [Clostridium sp. DSM 8431]